MATHDERFFKVEGAYNIRDLGGYPTKDGKETKMGAFLRADDLTKLTENDITKLKDAGLALEVDLRSVKETEANPSPLKNIDWVDYENVSMLDGMNSGKMEDVMPETMGDVYVWLMDNAKDAFATEMRLFINTNGLRLFHCTAGKDRTGTTAMLLLKLAGVSDEDILEDYALSEVYSAENIKNQIEMFKKQGMEGFEHMMYSKPENMQKALDHLHTTYGTVENYLHTIGLTEAEIAKLKNLLVD